MAQELSSFLRYTSLHLKLLFPRTYPHDTEDLLYMFCPSQGPRDIRKLACLSESTAGFGLWIPISWDLPLEGRSSKQVTNSFPTFSHIQKQPARHWSPNEAPSPCPCPWHHAGPAAAAGCPPDHLCPKGSGCLRHLCAPECEWYELVNE